MFDIGISFKDPQLVLFESFEMSRSQTYKGQVFMWDEGEVSWYGVISYLPKHSFILTRHLFARSTWLSTLIIEFTSERGHWHARKETFFLFLLP
jgi:hypothetical protein